MKTPSIGRNDPCPCGSGKKFKHCCLGKESGTSPAHGVTSASETLRNALKGQQFKSLEETQAFVTRHTQMQNQRPREEFHGLSPEQMHLLLNQPFNSPELVQLPELLDTQPTAPILTLFELLTNAIGEQGLKPTAKGNLPPLLPRGRSGLLGRGCLQGTHPFWQYQPRGRLLRPAYHPPGSRTGGPDPQIQRQVYSQPGLPPATGQGWLCSDLSQAVWGLCPTVQLGLPGRPCGVTLHPAVVFIHAVPACSLRQYLPTAYIL